MASEHGRFLWVDSDIMLDSQLRLTGRPCVANEYGMKHWSIVWSGNNPSAFAGATGASIQGNDSIGTIDILGTHWASTTSGEKVPRK